jgi:hypothetical protein
VASDVAWVALVGVAVAVATVEHIAALAVKMVVGIVVVAVGGVIEKAFAVAAVLAATVADKVATFWVAAESLDGFQRTGVVDVVVAVFADGVVDVVVVVAVFAAAA